MHANEATDDVENPRSVRSTHVSRRLFPIMAILGSLSVGLLLSELILRSVGYQPWQYEGVSARTPSMFRLDSNLGFALIEGDYVRHTPDGTAFEVTILPDGSRFTGEPLGDEYPRIAVVGGSVTNGWMISNHETYSAKLQAYFPTASVLNYGVPAYGTYQSLLVLEKLFEEGSPADVILYGFIQNHEHRNVAPAWWLRSLALQTPYHAVPFAELDAEGQLLRYPPERYPTWPLRDKLATVTLLQDSFMKAITYGRSKQYRTVTEALLLEMNELAGGHEADLLVVLLDASAETRSHYASFLESHDVSFVDCVFPLTPEHRVPIDGHPNGLANTRWAECIAGSLDQMLE